MNQRNVDEITNLLCQSVEALGWPSDEARTHAYRHAVYLSERGVLVAPALTENELERIWNAGWFNDAMGFPDEMREEMARVAKGEPIAA